MDFEKLNEIIFMVSGKRASGVEVHFADELGLSSLEMMNIAGKVEELLDIELDARKLKGISTVSDFLCYVNILSETVMFDVVMKNGESFTYIYEEKSAMDFIYYRLLRGYEGDRLSESKEVKDALEELGRGEVLTYETFKVERIG